MYGRRVGSVRPGKYSQKQLHFVEIDETRAESRQKSGFGALFGRMGHVDTGPGAPGLALKMVEAYEPPGVGTRRGRGPTRRDRVWRLVLDFPGRRYQIGWCSLCVEELPVRLLYIVRNRV